MEILNPDSQSNSKSLDKFDFDFQLESDKSCSSEWRKTFTYLKLIQSGFGIMFLGLRLLLSNIQIVKMLQSKLTNRRIFKFTVVDS